MLLRILGVLDICRDGKIVVPPRVKCRALLGILALQTNVAIPTARLADIVWSGRPPRSATANLRSYVCELRRLLDGSNSLEIACANGGYVLRAEPAELDSLEFLQLAEQGSAYLRSTDYACASQTLGRALSIWRGRVLDGLHLPNEAQVDAAFLEETRINVIEEYIDARLALGHHQQLTAELRRLTSLYPLRERLWQQLMLASFRSSRPVEALAAYRHLYRSLVDELGVAPSAATQLLHQRILQGDRSLNLTDLHMEPIARSPHNTPVPIR